MADVSDVKAEDIKEISDSLEALSCKSSTVRYKDHSLTQYSTYLGPSALLSQKAFDLTVNGSSQVVVNGASRHETYAPGHYSTATQQRTEGLNREAQSLVQHGSIEHKFGGGWKLTCGDGDGWHAGIPEWIVAHSRADRHRINTGLYECS